MGLRDKAKRAARKVKGAVSSDGPVISEVGDQYIVFDGDNNQHGPYDDRKAAAAKVRELKRESSTSVQDRAASFSKSVDSAVETAASGAEKLAEPPEDGEERREPTVPGVQMGGGGFGMNQQPADEEDGERQQQSMGGGFFGPPADGEGSGGPQVPGIGGSFGPPPEDSEADASEPRRPPWMMGPPPEGDSDDDDEMPPWMF